MRRVNGMAIAGVLMLGIGAGLFLLGGDAVPLWVGFLVGPLFWYLGFAVLLTWLLWRLFTPAEPETLQEEEPVTQVIKVEQQESRQSFGGSPMGVLHEIPAMGGFILLLLLTLALPARAADAPDGTALFKSKCAMCHGADAAGKTVMGAKLNIRDLRSPEVQKQSDAELDGAITKGKNKMPAYGEKLSANEIQALVAHIRDLGKK